MERGVGSEPVFWKRVAVQKDVVHVKSGSYENLEFLPKKCPPKNNNQTKKAPTTKISIPQRDSVSVITPPELMTPCILYIRNLDYSAVPRQVKSNVIWPR